MNKNIAYIIISVCLLLTAFFVYKSTVGSGGSGLSGIDADAKTWVMCKNSACKAETEMGERDFTAALVAKAKNAEPGRRSNSGLPCDQCGKPTVYRAVKCQESACQTVFLYGSVPSDFPDRCPQCKVSQTERSRQERRSGSAEE